MRVNRFLLLHNLLWAAYLILFLVSPLDYRISFQTIFLILGLVVFGNIAFHIGYRSIREVVPRGNGPINQGSVQKMYVFLVGMSLLYFFCIVLKYRELYVQYGFGFSLAGFSQLRGMLFDPGYTMGGSIIGIIANLLSGFPLLLIPFFALYRIRLRRGQKRILTILILLFLVSTFASGGRNGAMITILVALFSLLAIRKRGMGSKLKIPGYAKVFGLGVLVAVFFSFSKIFVDRAIMVSGSLEAYIAYFKMTHTHELRPYADALLMSPETREFYFPIMFFHEYIVHSLKEFEVIFAHESPLFPYLGAYQYYSFCIFLNKIGFQIISINEILADIPNPGRYNTLFGGALMDFGRWGLFPFVGVLYFLTGRALRTFSKTRTLEALVWFLYFFIIIFFSPIYSVIGIAMYPAFLVAGGVFSTMRVFGFFRGRKTIHAKSILLS